MKYIKQFEKYYDNMFYDKYCFTSDTNLDIKNLMTKHIDILEKENIKHYIFYRYVNNIFEFYIFVFTKTAEQSKYIKLKFNEFCVCTYNEFNYINNNWFRITKDEIDSSIELNLNTNKFNI